MKFPDVPQTLICEKCGATADVVRLESRHGEQLVIAKTKGKFYIQIDCPNCGRVQQEVKIT
jgi:hypothetical protein